MRYVKFIILLYTFSLFSVAGVALAEEPKLQAADAAGIFAAEQAKFIGEYHQKLLEKHDIDYRVLTTADDGDINIYTNKGFTAAKVGSLSKTGRGLLLVINPKQNLVRLEVSRGLESVFTDAFVSYIEHRQMIPFFKAGQVANGVLASTELIFARAADAQAGKAFDHGTVMGSTGGGAANKANIGSGAEAKSTQALNVTEGEDSPAGTVDLYLAAMKERNSNPELPIYSEATKEMQRKWVVTPAQMDMLSRTYAKCSREKIITSAQTGKAVVRYYSADRTCSPFFLVYENNAWKLDLTMMMKAIRFNHMNQWHFDMSVKHDYDFAFTDWSFDKNGYPTARKKLRWAMSWQTLQHQQTGQIATFITGVGKGSFAEKSGFIPGDIIIKWNNESMPASGTITRLIDMADEGEPFTIIIQRQDKQYTISGKSPPRS